MRALTTLIITIFTIIIGVNAMKDITSTELVKEFKLGWNLGNTLDAHCLDYESYYSDQTSSETCWLNPKATQELFNALSDNQFGVFRIPVTWSGHFGQGPDYKISSQWMNRVHEVVDYALNTNKYAILNIHHETWNHAFSKDLDTAKVIMKALWTQIAKEFEDKDEHLIFECMNEPRKVGDPIEWTGGDEESWAFINELNKICIDTIRSSSGNNPLRHIMIPTYAASVNETAIENLIYPTDDKKLIVSLHAYTPYAFTLDQSENSYSHFNDTTEKDIDWLMKTIKNTVLSKNIPVIIGEFGAVDRDNYEDRIMWAKYYISRAKANGIPCILWDNGVFSGDGELFGYIDRNTYKLRYPFMHYGFLCGLGKSKSCTKINEAIKTQNFTIEDDNKNSENDTKSTTQSTTTTITTTGDNNQNNNSTQTNEQEDKDDKSSVDYYHVIHKIKNIKLVYFVYFIVLLMINYY